MDVAPQISFRDIDSSEFVEKRVREEIDKLERYFSRITSCRVVVEAPHRHHHKGKLYHLRIEIGVPGRPEIVVGHEGHDKHAEHFPEMGTPAVSVGLGPLGLEYILANGGSGYFPMALQHIRRI